MELNGRSVLVTGGAGFIGSHLVDALMEKGCKVRVLDNFSAGKMEFLAHHGDNIEIIRGDCQVESEILDAAEGVDVLFHLAANPDVRMGADNTRSHLDQNIIGTFNALEAARKAGVKMFAFTSTSTVYGEADTIPTPEDYGPLLPISIYGASKLASEALISSWCNTFPMEAVLYRFANCVGPRSTHGVTYDFVHKLRKEPGSLEILGCEPGTKKSYFHVHDCVQGMLVAIETAKAKVEVFNIGSHDYIDVKEIADIIVSEMGLDGIPFNWTGGVDGGRAWMGDVKVMYLTIDRIMERGWIPKYNSAEAIRATVKELVKSE